MRHRLRPPAPSTRTVRLARRRARPGVLLVPAVALAVGLGGTGTALAAPGATTEVLSVAGTLQQAVVDDPHEHGHGELVLDSMIEVGGSLYDLPETAAGLAAGAPGDLVTGDDVVVSVQARTGTSGTQALTRAAAGTDPRARVVAVAGEPGSPAASPSEAATAPSTTTDTDVHADGRAAAAEPTLAPALTSVLGDHTLTVLPVHWTAPTTSRTTLTTVASEAARYWSEQSAGRILFRSTVREWRAIADPGSCDTAAIMRAALAAHGVSAARGNAHVAVYFPERPDCGGWAGMGTISGGNVWVNGVPTVDVLAHELGHNLGLGHANTATCTSGGVRVSLSGTCSVDAYADMADVMGYATTMPSGSLNTALADRLGLASVLEVTDLPATVDVARLADVGSPRAVRLATSFGTVYVDFRPAQGRDVRRTAWAGVQVHRLVGGSYPESQLLDMQPSRRTAFSAPALPTGGSWDVPGTGRTLRVTATGETHATLELVPTGGTPTPPPAPLAASDLTFVPVTPTRLLDTRQSGTPLGAHATRQVPVAGRSGVPATASAVALNVTAVGATSRTHLRAWPAGRAMPGSSVLNTDPSRVVATGTMLGVGSNGAVSLYNDAGEVHVVVDVTGYYVPSGGVGFEALGSPTRVLDTRSAGGRDAPAVTSGGSRTVPIAGRYGVPADATAVVVNVTSVDPASPGYLVAYPAGTTRPLASTVNHLPGGAATNRAAVRLGNGALTVALEGGAGHVLVDLVGWYGPSGRGLFTPVQPVRAFDTRLTGSPVRAGEARALDVRTPAGAPADARTAVMTLIATGSTAPATYVTAWGGTTARPATSDLNVRPGVDQSNLLVVPWAADGRVRIFNNLGTVHLVGDVTGYFS